MFVEFFPDKSDYFSHGKCGQNGANSKSFDASETNACDQCGGCQTYDIKGYFYFWVFEIFDGRQFSWKEIRRDDRQSAAVGKCDSEAEQQITDDKVKDSHWNVIRKNGNPSFVNIQHHAERETNHETKQIFCYEAFTKDHQWRN